MSCRGERTLTRHTVTFRLVTWSVIDARKQSSVKGGWMRGGGQRCGAHIIVSMTSDSTDWNDLVKKRKYHLVARKNTNSDKSCRCRFSILGLDLLKKLGT